MKMYKVVVKSFIADRNSSIYDEDTFTNKVNGTFIFNKECAKTVVEDLANEITGRVLRHSVYGGIDKNVPTNIEIVDDFNVRGYITFACEKVDVVIVVDFIEV